MLAKLSGVTAVSAALLLASGSAFAHCDGLDGPVAKAAFQALDAGNVNQVLIWVKKNDETEIKHAFEHALSVRKLSPAAKELADRYFLEALVRVDRAGALRKRGSSLPTQSWLPNGIVIIDNEIGQRALWRADLAK